MNKVLSQAIREAVSDFSPKATEYQKLGGAAYGLVKRRLRMARETLIRSGMAAELAARSDSGV